MKRTFTLALVATALVAVPLIGQLPQQPDNRQREIPKSPTRRTRPDAAPEIDHRPHVIGDRWFEHASPNDSRYRMAHPFSHGRFTRLGPTYPYAVQRVNQVSHRLWLAGGFGFEIANWEWPLTTGWCWTCGERFVIYEDPDHIGWYLMLNTETNEYVHVMYAGD